MNKILFLILNIITINALATDIQEGSCYSSANLPGYKIKVKQVGKKLILVESGIGNIAQSFDKEKFLDELNIGILKEVSCLQEEKKPPVYLKPATDLFNIALDTTFPEFQIKYKKKIKICNEENYKRLLDISNGEEIYTKAKMKIKKCELEGEIKVTFSEVYRESSFNITEIFRDIHKQKITMKNILKKFNEKLKHPLIEEFQPAGNDKIIYKYGPGRLEISYKRDYSTKIDYVTTITYESKPSLYEQSDKREDDLKQKEIKSKSKDKKLDIPL